MSKILEWLRRVIFGKKKVINLILAKNINCINSLKFPSETPNNKKGQTPKEAVNNPEKNEDKNPPTNNKDYYAFVFSIFSLSLISLLLIAIMFISKT